jgi:hypothetical protein
MQMKQLFLAPRMHSAFVHNLKSCMESQPGPQRRLVRFFFFSAHQIDDEVDGSDDEEDSLTKHAGPVLKKKGGRLLATTLDIARVRDLTHRGECKVSTPVSFSYIRL